MPQRLVFLFAIVSLPAGAEECYSVQSAGSSVTFEVKQAGSPFRGGFRRFGGEICLARGRATRIDVWLEPASVDSGLPEIDAALKEDEFFAVARYPRIAFAGKSVDVRDKVQIARGTIEIKGKRRDIEVAFGLRPDGARTILSGSFALNRLDYGVGTGEWSNTAWLAAGVKVDFSAALSRKPEQE